MNYIPTSISYQLINCKLFHYPKVVINGLTVVIIDGLTVKQAIGACDLH